MLPCREWKVVFFGEGGGGGGGVGGGGGGGGGARCSSVVRAFAHGAVGRRIDPSWGGVDPLSYYSFQPVLHDWCKQRPWYVLSCMWDGAYKRTLAANR